VIDLTVGPWAEAMTSAEVTSYSASKLPIAGLPPTIIFHGTADTTVPIQTSRDFCGKATAANRTCQLVEYEGLNHGFYTQHDVIASVGIAPFEDTLAKTSAFLSKVLPQNSLHELAQ
jgi:dipeptidyl aminopeptidase/acylaminoacyl peptidase